MIPGFMSSMMMGSGPPKALVLIDRTLGTNRGDMTSGGGLAAAFDGVTNQASASSAIKSTASTSGYVGKTLATSRVIGRVVTYGSNNSGYRGGAAGLTLTITLYAKNGAAPTSATDGAVIGTSGSFANTSGANPQTIDSTDLTTSWAHVWAVITVPTAVAVVFAELQLYAWE